MSLLAAATSDEGGITGFLLELVDRLGAVGVCLSILAETVIPPIPSEAVLGLAGVLINNGEMSIVPVILFATLGSILGAVFFYYVGRALGPRRSHAFLDRLPLVETADVDRTFAWFERHGRSAVFFGRMVPIVRSFISVPAGVVRMPFGQFILYSAAGSLIWNSLLVTLGVLAGDFIQDNLKYLDYLVVAVVVGAVGWFVYRKASGKLRRPPTAGVDLPNQEALAATLGRLKDRGATVVLVAHELGPMRRLVDRAIVMRDGRVAYDGPPLRDHEVHEPWFAEPHTHHHHPVAEARPRPDHAPHVSSPLDRPNGGERS